MRRALLPLILSAVPTLALGSDSVTFRSDNMASVSAINLAQCKHQLWDGTGTAPKLSDDLNVDITWTNQLPAGTTATNGGVYRIYVSQNQSQAGQPLTTTGTGTDCQKDTSNNSLSGGVKQVGGDIAFTGQTQTSNGYVMSDIVAAAGYNCTDSSSPFVYVCVQQFSGNNIVGFATGKLLLDRSVPVPPTVPSISAGDSALHVSCHAGSGDSVGTGGGYKARATPTNSTMETKFSGENTSCDLEISGLVNDQSYDVVVYRLNENHNPSAASPSKAGTPIPTFDYWNDYKGRERGGCGTAAGAAGLFAALAALAALASLRRRNS